MLVFAVYKTNRSEERTVYSLLSLGFFCSACYQGGFVLCVAVVVERWLCSTPLGKCASVATAWWQALWSFPALVALNILGYMLRSGRAGYSVCKRSSPVDTAK